MAQTKKWYKSKTVWFNAVSGLFLLLDQLIPAMGYLLSPLALQIYTGIVTAGNVILRYFTKDPIKKTGHTTSAK
jgi:hypothetical protein